MYRTSRSGPLWQVVFELSGPCGQPLLRGTVYGIFVVHYETSLQYSVGTVLHSVGRELGANCF